MLLSHQEDGMGRRGYPAEFRQRVLDLVAAGRRVRDVAVDLGISDQTVYGWRRQERMDQGIEPGLPQRSARSWRRRGGASESSKPSSPSIARRPSC
jgi:transposase-like protein